MRNGIGTIYLVMLAMTGVSATSAGAATVSSSPGNFILTAESFPPSSGTFADFVSVSGDVTLNTEAGAGDPATSSHWYAEWTPALIGDEYASDGDENFNVIFSSLQTAFAIDYVDTGDDSLFTLDFYDGSTLVDSSSFVTSAPFSVQKFVGFISVAPFDRVEIREDDGPNNSDEYFQFFTATASDTDADGVPNLIDICPLDFDPLQEDADGDGVGDACDSCNVVDACEAVAGWKEIARSDGTTPFSSTTYTEGICGCGDPNYAEPASNFAAMGTDVVIRIEMGDFTDYFTPTAGALDLEGMLTSNASHLWSSDEAGPFVVPAYGTSGLGGSSVSWPPDGRSFLSFWGSTASDLGGCCQSSPAGATAWGQPFVMSIQVAQPVLVPSLSRPGMIALTALLLLGMKATRLRKSAHAGPSTPHGSN